MFVIAVLLPWGIARKKGLNGQLTIFILNCINDVSFFYFSVDSEGQLDDRINRGPKQGNMSFNYSPLSPVFQFLGYGYQRPNTGGTPRKYYRTSITHTPFQKFAFSILYVSHKEPTSVLCARKTFSPRCNGGTLNCSGWRSWGSPFRFMPTLVGRFILTVEGRR